MFQLRQPIVHVLDAGAGAGGLTAALVATLISRPHPPSEIDLTAVELDARIIPALRQTMAACADIARARGVVCRWRIIEADYLQIASEAIALEPSESATTHYDAAILNPPYKKITTGSHARRYLESVGLTTTNLYAGFVGLAVAQLAPGGEYVAITPRSWCNGTYFESFRRWLLSRSSLATIHIYGRRDVAFASDSVLTENVIYHGVRGAQQRLVTITESVGPTTPNMAVRHVPFEMVVRPEYSHSYIHLSTDPLGREAADAVRALPATLADLGVQVSTGRVVEFRAKPWLRSDPQPDGAPLIYPAHFGQINVEWPKLGGKKPNGLASDAPKSLLVPSGHYVLIKRFSSKEERRRIVATVFDPANVPCEKVGFENHLNYIHSQGQPLDPEMAYGIAAFLNTEVIDLAFRQFSGHTQVNAADLRALRYPSAETLRTAGAAALRGQHEDAGLIVNDALVLRSGRD